VTIKELKITERQLNKIHDLIFSFEMEMTQMKNKSNLQSCKLRKLRQDKRNLDYEKIREAFSKELDISYEISIKRLKLRDEIENILIPELNKAKKARRNDYDSKNNCDL